MYGTDSKVVNWMWLDPVDCCSWSTMAEAIYKFQYVHAVSLTKWEAYLMGGNSDYHGQSTRYNSELEFRQMWHIHLGTGMFGIPTMKDLRTILSTCKGNITKLPLQEFLKMQQY